MTGLAAATPGGHWGLGDGGSVLAFTGAPVAGPNGVLNVAARPSVDGIEELAALAAREMATVTGAFGADREVSAAFMLRSLRNDDLPPHVWFESQTEP